MTKTPEQIAARLYPDEGLATQAASRAAFLHGLRLGKAGGDAEGYARAKAKFEAQFRRCYTCYRRVIEEGMSDDLSPTSPAPEEEYIDMPVRAGVHRRLARIVDDESPAPGAGEPCRMCSGTGKTLHDNEDNGPSYLLKDCLSCDGTGRSLAAAPDKE